MQLFWFNRCSYAKRQSGETKNNLFVIDDKTTISFVIPEDRYLYSKSVNENTNILDLSNINFIQYKDVLDFESYQFYIKKVRIKNNGIERKRISIISGENHVRSEFFLISGNDYNSFANDSGGRNVNSLASVNPEKVKEQNFKLRHFTFNIEPGQAEDIFYKYQLSNTTNNITNKLLFYHTEKFQEARRFGLWLEGIIFGSLIALAIFSFYSYFQIKDRTTLYYGLWLVTAMGVVIGQGTHDGTRLFEFIMRPFDENPFFDTAFPTTVAGITGYSQAMMFVIFARQFINLNNIIHLLFNLQIFT